jgi:hypothetical protein
MGTMDATMDVLLGNKILDLRVVSSRQIFHGASRNMDRESLHDHRVELKCNVQRTLSDNGVVVGDHPEEILEDLEFSIELRSAQKIFGELDAKRVEEVMDARGFLQYHPPIPPEQLAGLPPSVIEESKKGSVTGWVFFGNETMRDVARLLVTEPHQEIHLAVTVSATRSPTQSSLTYETKEYHPTRYRWHAHKEWLVVKEARIVAIPRAATAAQDAPNATAEDAPNATAEPSIQIVSQKISDALDTLNSNFRTLQYTLLIGFILILFELWRLR